MTYRGQGGSESASEGEDEVEELHVEPFCCLILEFGVEWIPEIEGQ
jgi:hypothetical protein